MTLRAGMLAAVDRHGPVPLPGAGRTAERFATLAELGACDLAVARLVEGHLDALAILAEAGAPPPDGLLGVWAADPPSGRIRTDAGDGGWVLRGTKLWCSGAGTLDHALVTAHADDGYRLLCVPLDHGGVSVARDRWQAVGMRGSETFSVTFRDVLLGPDAAIADPGWYLRRRGFWIGGAGVAACWYGGALGALRALRAAVGRRDADPHGAAHLGAADALCAAMWALLEQTADAVDAGLEGGALRRRAWQVRAAVERLAPEVLRHAERGIGAGGLTADPAMARRAADLPIYLRQHHAEADLAALGTDLLDR